MLGEMHGLRCVAHGPDAAVEKSETLMMSLLFTRPTADRQLARVKCCGYVTLRCMRLAVCGMLSKVQFICALACWAERADCW